MKKIFLTLIVTFFYHISYSQTDGITYQAVIIDNNPQEIPGVDIPSNNLPNTELQVRFTIIDDTGSLEYQETQNTTTDPYGMINLVIGKGTPVTGAFDEIYWNNSKFLRVEIDLNNGDGLVEFSYQELTYIPYVRHREIIATSTLDVDGDTNLNSNFTVNNQSPTYLTGDLTVDGLVAFDGPLEVGGDTHLYADLTVEGTATFQDSNFQNINVAQNSTLNVVTASGTTTLNDTLTANQKSFFNDRVKVSAGEGGDVETNYDAYALQVEGFQQGIAVKLQQTIPNRSNNYMSFWDGNNQPKGRIEASSGLTTVSMDEIFDLLQLPDFGDIIDADPSSNPPTVAANQYFNNDYAFGAYALSLELVNAIIRFGVNAAAASGLCVAGDCDDAVWSFIDIVVAGIQLGGYITYNEINIGVAFESGGADYAEWLEKFDSNEVFTFGDVAGIKGGKISKTFINAEKFMVISQNPTVIGAMPNSAKEKDYEKVAFMGQIPVKVVGEVNIGDYILPSGNNDGMAIAVSSDKMVINDYARIVGVAWSESKGDKLFDYVRTAVGINSNDTAAMVRDMQNVLNKMQEAIVKLSPDYEARYYDVGSISSSNSNLKTSSVPSLNEIVATKIGSFEYKNMKEALEIGKDYAVDQNFDLSKLPYINEMIENPSDENINKIVSHYTKVLENLKSMEESARKN